MIKISHLTKKYGDHIAVNDISFTIEPGRIYGFLGPNGAGKSTTMNMMTGYLGSTSGTINVFGHDMIKEPAAAKKHIGYLPEIPPLYMDMTVMEYLKFVAELKGIAKSEREYAIDDAIEMTDLGPMSKRLIKNLSKGYKQRVGLAQAIMGTPDVIILDEPTVGLDPKQIIEIRQLIRNLGKDHTVILSSHILSEIKELCDYIFIIAGGELVASDTTEELVKNFSSDEQIVEILAKCDIDTAREAARRLETVKDIKAVDNEDGTTSLTITAVKGVDIREELFNAFVAAGISILEIKTKETSLETIFLELTENARKYEPVRTPDGSASEENTPYESAANDTAPVDKTFVDAAPYDMTPVDKAAEKITPDTESYETGKEEE